VNLNFADDELLSSLFKIDPITGDLFWRERDLSTFNGKTLTLRQRTWRNWNKRYADKPVGCVDKTNRYIKFRFEKKSYFAHRIIYRMVYGEWPEQVDHINGIRTDNRKENLRNVSDAENRRNMKRASNNTSGATGIFWHSQAKKWAVQIWKEKVCYNLGLFSSFEEAVAIRKAAEKDLDFHENHGTIR